MKIISKFALILAIALLFVACAGVKDDKDAVGGNMGPPPDGAPPPDGMGPPNMWENVPLDEALEIAGDLIEKVGYASAAGGYPIVDTSQDTFYDNQSEVSENVAFYGQDAHYEGTEPSYTDNSDGTITDNITGLMWQQDPGEKMTWLESTEKLATFNLGGYDDWRLPTIKELYSLVDFSGITVGRDFEGIPYLDTDYFVFHYGAADERPIDSQMTTSTIYESTTMNNDTTMFGFNFADGRIKGYPVGMGFYTYYVRGNTNYGQNQFVDNDDGTITDEATDLMWMKYDSGNTNEGENGDGRLDWENALSYCEDLEYAGYDDWYLPNAKELQSIIDYTRSPDITNSAALDEIFSPTPMVNMAGDDDYGFYWTSTTHLDGGNLGTYAVYFCLGKH